MSSVLQNTTLVAFMQDNEIEFFKKLYMNRSPGGIMSNFF